MKQYLKSKTIKRTLEPKIRSTRKDKPTIGSQMTNVRSKGHGGRRPSNLIGRASSWEEQTMSQAVYKFPYVTVAIKTLTNWAHSDRRYVGVDSRDRS